MPTPDDSHLAPWNQPRLQASYFAKSISSILRRDDKDSNDLWSPFPAGFLFVTRGPSKKDADNNFSSAVLHKISTRGSPTFCSPALEEDLLIKTGLTGLIDYLSKNGYDSIPVASLARGLRSNLMGSLFPELLISDDELQELLTKYRQLCTRPEQLLFDSILEKLTEPRLALLLTPQRTFASMGIPERVNERVDFAIEVPPSNGSSGLRLVLEVDGEEHLQEQGHLDKERDVRLKRDHWEVLRFKTREIDEWDDRVAEVSHHISEAFPKEVLDGASTCRRFPLNDRGSHPSLILLPLAEGRLLQALSLILFEGGRDEITISDPQGIGLQPVVERVNALVSHLWNVHGNSPPRIKLVEHDGDLACYVTPCAKMWEDVFNGKGVVGPSSVPSVAPPSLLNAAARVVEIGEDKLESMRALLNYIMRKQDFRPFQLDIIARSLRREKVVALLPTGAGKSLCYQLSSMLQPGVTLIVDPLRSLMLDQEQNMRDMGITRSLAIMKGGELPPGMSDRDYTERMYQRLRSGQVLFAFVSPERLQMPDFHSSLCHTGNVQISHFVIDEAHCVSEWGHDFRPAYLNVGRRAASLSEGGNAPTVMALTGTASKNVLVDIKRDLGITADDAIVQPRSFDRTELEFDVRCVPIWQRDTTIKEMTQQVVEEMSEGGEVPSGIVFTNFATPRDVGVLRLRDLLSGSLDLPMDVYSGTPPERSIDERSWEVMKREAQERFKRDESKLMVCTHGFGMGIDKPNIRFTFNIMLPRSLEEFYQQAGRAGRDGRRSKCLVLFTDNQADLADSILDTEDLDFDSFIKKVNAHGVRPKNQGDAVRNTYFLTNSFLGEKEEMKAISSFAQAKMSLYPGPQRMVWSFADRFPEGETAKEKVLYRLLLVGGIDDYFKDYSSRRFIVLFHLRPPGEYYEMLFSYLDKFLTPAEMQKWRARPRKIVPKDAIIDCAEALMHFIYERVVKRRRRAIGQMLQVARVGVTSKDEFRRQLLAYLQESEFTPYVNKVSTSDDVDVWLSVLPMIKDQTDLEKVIGACRRELEDNPSHPGLLLLSGMNTMLLGDKGENDLRSAFLSMSRLTTRKREYSKLAYGVIVHARRIDRSKVSLMCKVMLETGIIEVAREIYLNGEEEELSLNIMMSNLVEVLGLEA